MKSMVLFICLRNDFGVILLVYVCIFLVRVVWLFILRNILLILVYFVLLSWFWLYFLISWCSRLVVFFIWIGSVVKLMFFYWRYKDNMLIGFKVLYRSIVFVRRFLFVVFILILYIFGFFLLLYIVLRVSRI